VNQGVVERGLGERDCGLWYVGSGPCECRRKIRVSGGRDVEYGCYISRLRGGQGEGEIWRIMRNKCGDGLLKGSFTSDDCNSCVEKYPGADACSPLNDRGKGLVIRHYSC